MTAMRDEQISDFEHYIREQAPNEWTRLCLRLLDEARRARAEVDRLKAIGQEWYEGKCLAESTQQAIAATEAAHHEEVKLLKDKNETLLGDLEEWEAGQPPIHREEILRLRAEVERLEKIHTCAKGAHENCEEIIFGFEDENATLREQVEKLESREASEVATILNNELVITCGELRVEVEEWKKIISDHETTYRTIREEEDTLRARVAALDAEIDKLVEGTQRAQDAEAESEDRLATCSKENAALRARVAALEDKLSMILPMALGYAHEHPVGDNQGKCESAKQTLEEDA